MIAVVQRVSRANVVINKEIFSNIGHGLLIFLGICRGDTEDVIKSSARKIIDLRIFTDENEKMNLCIKDISGEALVVSQFTLCSDKDGSGNRPSFMKSEEPARANTLYELAIKEMMRYYIPEKIKTGVFAAKMKINLTNDGPVTIILDK